MSRRSKTLVLVLGAGVAAFVVGLGVQFVLDRYPSPGSAFLTAGTAASTPTKAGNGFSMGGDFSLIDHTGKPVTNREFEGEFLLVYFGYTFCRDACPTDLRRMTVVLDALGPLADKVRPIFITIDPERDTVEVLADYIGNFHPRFIGLSGSAQQVRAAAKAYGVYYSKVSRTGASAAHTAHSDYLMNHTSFVYLMGPDGKMRDIFRRGLRNKFMIKRLGDAVRGNAAGGKGA